MLGAAGIEYRIEELDNLTSKTRPQAYRDDMSLTFGNDFAGETKVAEAFFEIELPLLADKRGAELWNINTAVRRTHYDNTETSYSNGAVNGQHDVTSWKVSMAYDPVEWVRIRASRSQDIRAAGFRELYYQQSIQSGAPNGRVTNPYTRVPNDEAFVLLTGAPDSCPSSRTRTRSASCSRRKSGRRGCSSPSTTTRSSSRTESSAAPRSSSPITAPRQPAPIRRRSNGRRCARLWRSGRTCGAPGDNVASVLAPYYNDLPYEASGVDFGGNYSFDIGGSRQMSLRLLASHALNQQVVIGTARIERDIAGQTGNEGFLARLHVGRGVELESDRELQLGTVDDHDAGPLHRRRQDRSREPPPRPQRPALQPGARQLDCRQHGPVALHAKRHGVLRLHGSRYGNRALDVRHELWDKEPPFSAGGTGGVNGIFYDTMGACIAWACA